MFCFGFFLFLFPTLLAYSDLNFLSQPQGQNLDEIVVSVPQTPAHGAVARLPSQVNKQGFFFSSFLSLLHLQKQTRLQKRLENARCPHGVRPVNHEQILYWPHGGSGNEWLKQHWHHLMSWHGKELPIYTSSLLIVPWCQVQYSLTFALLKETSGTSAA